MILIHHKHDAVSTRQIIANKVGHISRNHLRFREQKELQEFSIIN